MEKEMSVYQKCVKQLLSEYEPLATERSNVELLFDDERMPYLAVRIGWFQQKRIHLCLAHIDITDDAVLVQCNNTEYHFLRTRLVRNRNAVDFALRQALALFES